MESFWLLHQVSVVLPATVNTGRSQLQASNPSIERTFQRPLRALCAAAHVER